MKIAEVCPYDLSRPGGVQTQVRALVAEFATLGHEAELIGPGLDPRMGRIRGVPSNDAVARISLAPRVWHNLPARLESFDVVHVHEPLMPVVATAAGRANVPLLGTLHADPTPLVRSLLRAGLGRRTLHNYGLLTAVSPVAASAVGGAEIIPNAVDRECFEPVEKQPGRVVFVGRDEPRKGLGVLIEAWGTVASARPGAELIVISDRTDGPAGVVWAGPVSDTHRRRLMGSAAIACAPNLRGESFGMVIAEGLAAGCAVVASDLPAFRWVAGSYADFVPVGDPRRLADALIARLDAPAVPRSQRQGAARFSWDSVAPRYEAALQSVRSGD